MSTAPDFAEPIIAWRSWLVVETVEGPRLHSTARAQVWQPQRPLAAVCRPPSRLLPWPRREPHGSPQETCSCGIYAAADLRGALAALDPYPRLGWKVRHRVIGRVAMWGRVIECDNGWRAEHAYPALIAVPRRRLHDAPAPDADALAAALEIYGVPVMRVDAAARSQILRSIEGAPAPT